MIEPARDIVSFIRAQVEPIRDNLWFDVAVAFKCDRIRPKTDMEALGIEVLSELSDSEAFHRCIHVIGWLDFSLGRDFASVEEFHVHFAETSDDPLTKKIALAAPLRRRYFEQAARDWKKLRQTTLSPKALHRFHNWQLARSVRS